jgi:hypothetical protein
MKVIAIPSNVPTSVIKEAIKLYEFNGQFVVTLNWAQTKLDADKLAEDNGVSVTHKSDSKTFMGPKDDIVEVLKAYDDGATDFIRDNDIEGLIKHYGVKKSSPAAIATDVKTGELVHA